MTFSKDSMGRPIVVVTGAGVITSLGAGKMFIGNVGSSPWPR
jgi:hypothetical protein